MVRTRGSRLRIQDVIEAAQKADTICYVILIADRGFYGGFGYSGDSEMHKLAEATGGLLIEVGNKQDKLEVLPSIRSRTSCAASTTLATRRAITNWTERIARSRSRPRAITRCRLGKGTTLSPRISATVIRVRTFLPAGRADNPSSAGIHFHADCARRDRPGCSSISGFSIREKLQGPRRPGAKRNNWDIQDRR